MTNKQQNEFDEWYLTVKNQTFNFIEQIRYYCKLDVYILSEACKKYRQILLENFNCDPLRYFTLQQVAIAIFRAQYLVPNTIGIHIEHNDQFSKKSIQWLESLYEHEDIQHA
jgi:hypothetical protein